MTYFYYKKRLICYFIINLLDFTSEYSRVGGSYVHARGFSVHHVFRYITVTVSVTSHLILLVTL